MVKQSDSLLKLARTRGYIKTLQVGYNASGAVVAAQKGDVVVIVDIIDMSTTAEAALEAGALMIFGVSPDDVHPPVQINPKRVSNLAGIKALEKNTEVIIITEPRWGTEEERRKRVQLTLAGVNQAGAKVIHILPNIGGEISKLADFKDKIVVIASDTGGVAFDAAINNGAKEVMTATISRVLHRKGLAPMEISAKRAIDAANRHQTGISFIAASSNSYEDILAAETLAKKVIEFGFLKSM